MKIVFMGTPDFAVASLKRIHEEGIEISAVVTSPDKPAGRGMKIHTSAVKDFAIANGLKILQPSKLSEHDFVNELKSLEADIFVVVAFRMLPELIWKMPKKGTFNLHASLLPKYRGAAPINWAIINGEKVTGVTTFLIDEKIDTGNILMQQEIDISDDDNAGTLHDKLMEIGSEMVVKTIRGLGEGNLNPRPQINENATLYAPKLNSENTRIHWANNAQQIHNFVRGLNPYPGCSSTLSTPEGKRLVRIIKTRIIDTTTAKDAGKIEIIGKNHLLVHCGRGKLEIIELQPEGKKRMSSQDFINGVKNIQDFHFSN